MLMRMHHLPSAFAVLLLAKGAFSNSALPVVDLGYELHQAISYNDSTDILKFSNIRYAQPPTGELRFRAPLSPLVDREDIQNGSETRICPQGVPAWQAAAFKPIGLYSNGKSFSLSSWEADMRNSTAPPIDFNSESAEDCLFLDVHVPRKIFDAAQDSECEAPVLVWIHGGGYALGSKNAPEYEPSGLLKHSQEVGEGMIFVPINYRLGALGFLAGPEVEKDGDLNAGLLDQRLALQWIQDNIHLFGGSSKRVTVMGESAGGGSVLLHSLESAWKNNTNAPFAQVIAQSPAIIPTATAPESAFTEFLQALNVSTLAEARKLSSEAIIQGNARQIGSAPPANYIHGPVKDGLLIPDLPLSLFRQGAFNKNVKMLTAHNGFEGSFFYDPKVKSDDEFHQWLERAVPGLSDSEIDFLENELYPSTFGCDLGYVDQSSRQMALWGEAVIDCTFQATNEGFNGSSYAYRFDVTPGLHTQDLKYTFNNPTAPAFAPKAQDLLQMVIASFVVNGEPIVNDTCLKSFPRWGTDENLVSITETQAKIDRSQVNTTRCDWWQSRKLS